MSVSSRFPEAPVTALRFLLPALYQIERPSVTLVVLCVALSSDKSRHRDLRTATASRARKTDRGLPLQANGGGTTKVINPRPPSEDGGFLFGQEHVCS